MIDYPLVHLRISARQDAGRVVVSNVLVVAVFGARDVGQIAADCLQEG